MPRWALILIVAPLAMCVGCASVGYFVVVPWARARLNEGRSDVTREMEDAVYLSVSRRIEASEPPSGGLVGGDELVLGEADLNVNNTVRPSGSGFETGTGGTRIYGVVTQISPAGIALLLPGVIYSGVPVVEGGGVELTRIEASADVLGFIISEDIFEQSLEGGINRALERRGLRPVSITLETGSMTIKIEPASCPVQSSGCPMGTPIDRGVAEFGSRERFQLALGGR
jgi:hypothetical protein